MRIRSTKLWLIVLAMSFCGVGVLGSSRAEAQNQTTDRLKSTEQQLKQKEEQLKQMEAQLKQRAAEQYGQQLVLSVQDGQAGEVVAKAVAGVPPRKNFADTFRKAAEAVRDTDGDEAKAAANKNLARLRLQPTNEYGDW